MIPTGLIRGGAVVALNVLLTLPGSGVLPRLLPATGFDISYPQCPANFPAGGSFGIVGVNGGRAWSTNSCVSSEYGWATAKSGSPAFYANTGNPGPISVHWGAAGPRPCVNPSSYNDLGCAYDYGWDAAQQSLGVAGDPGRGRWWWLDVETSNSWNGDYASNSADIQGALDYLRAQRVPGVGVYSSGYQWGQITGGYSLGAAPDWLAGASSQAQATSWCRSARGFSGGSVKLVQFPSGGYDGDVAC